MHEGSTGNQLGVRQKIYRFSFFFYLLFYLFLLVEVDGGGVGGGGGEMSELCVLELVDRRTCASI